MLYSLLFVTACCTVCYLLPHAVKLLFVATCRTVFFLLHAVHFAICCRTLYSLPFIATCRTVAIYCHMLYSLLFVATCHATCNCNSMLQSLLFMHAMQYAAPFVAAWIIVGYWLPHPRIRSLLFVVASRTAFYLLQHALQFPICCRMLYRLLFVVACHAVCHMF